MVALNTLVALDFTFLPLVIALTVARQYILRHRDSTPASVISDVSLWLFTTMIVAIGSLELRNVFIEKELRTRWSNESEIKKRLITPAYQEINFAALILYTTQLWLLKAAYLGYFFRVTRHLTQSTRRLLIFTTVYAAVGFVIAMTIQLAYCHPIQRNWSTGPDVCVSLSTIVGSTVQAWLNLTADLLILAIAILAVTSLQMGNNERTALTFVVALGSVSPVMCLLRFIEVYKAASTPAPGSGVALSVVRQIYLWGKFEVCFAHIAFCLPALRAFIRWTRERTTSYSNRSKGKFSSSGNSTDVSRQRHRPYSGFGGGHHGGPRRMEDELGVSTPESEIELNPMRKLSQARSEDIEMGLSPARSPETRTSESRKSSLGEVVTMEDVELEAPVQR